MFVKPTKIELITSDDSKVVISLHPSQKMGINKKRFLFYSITKEYYAFSNGRRIS